MKITIINLQNRVPVNSKKVVKIVQKVLVQESIKHFPIPLRKSPKVIADHAYGGSRQSRLRRIPPKAERREGNFLVSSEGIKKSGEITICFVNDQKIKELNLRYLAKNNPTDVIAFDVAEPKRPDKLFADIVISTDRAIDNANAFKTSPLFELYLYVIHGVLHILGYDDRSKKDRLIMRKREAELVKTCPGTGKYAPAEHR
ncbi:MAG: rRNA maturation RNase YbeY [Candidatus Omnitrophota bacterium]|nr:rRNA maturation RNase YbeY [Candidatus Omnitrophota bacterium]